MALPDEGRLIDPEVREGATGRGAKPKAGLTGFTVSNLRIPGFVQPWETPEAKSPRIADTSQRP